MTNEPTTRAASPITPSQAEDALVDAIVGAVRQLFEVQQFAQGDAGALIHAELAGAAEVECQVRLAGGSAYLRLVTIDNGDEHRLIRRIDLQGLQTND